MQKAHRSELFFDFNVFETPLPMSDCIVIPPSNQALRVGDIRVIYKYL